MACLLREVRSINLEHNIFVKVKIQTGCYLRRVISCGDFIVLPKKKKKNNTKTLKTAEESELGAVMGNVEVTQHSLILCTISHTEMMENNTV